MNKFTRRTFLKTGSAAFAAAAIPYGLASPAPVEERPLLFRAIEAARLAGASYVDAQIYNRVVENWRFVGNGVLTPINKMVYSVGVRALVNGCWGFAATDARVGEKFTSDDMARLGSEAAAQGKMGTLGGKRQVDLAPAPTVEDGRWVMPVEIDPFEVSDAEKVDFIMSVADFYARQDYGIGTTSSINFTRDDRSFASSEGSFFTQRTYLSEGSVMVSTERHFRTNREGYRMADFLTPAGAGWEYIRNAPFKDSAERLVEEASRMRVGKPVSVGRYDIVFDPYAMAKILSASVGGATNLERAFGYHANSIGTSFLNEPAEMLGVSKVASSQINIIANRSMPGGAATVKWDGEGVAPTTAVLVKSGVLNDFQTSRESASWLEPYYSKLGRPVISNGCSGTYSATAPQTIIRPNLVLEPGSTNETFESLVSGVKKGLAIVGGQITMDHQCLNGAGIGELVYEVANGKLGALIGGASYLFRTPEFWNNVVALGGKSSSRIFGFSDWPSETLGMRAGGLSHSVSAVPAKVSQVSVVDVMRKA